MLPMIPLLVLAYAVLYAFAAAIPHGYVELQAQEALSLSIAPAVISPTPKAHQDLLDTSAATVRRFLTDIHVIRTEETEQTENHHGVSLDFGENKGFFHRGRCKSTFPTPLFPF